MPKVEFQDMLQYNIKKNLFKIINPMFFHKKNYSLAITICAAQSKVQV